VGEIWDFTAYDPYAPCSSKWQGLTCQCNSTATTIHTIRLPGYCLDGTIPSSIGELTGLRYLELFVEEHVTGTIPAEISLLTNLKSLTLERCNLVSSIPWQIFQITSLLKIQLGYLQVNGSLPAQTDLPSLVALNLFFNQLTGTLPDFFDSMSRLITFSIAENRIHGSLPASLFRKTMLNHLEVYNNQMSGSIPQNLTLLTTLEYLFFYGNRFTGTIPAELGKLTNLYSFSFLTNFLTGPMPSTLHQLTNLNQAMIGDNLLTGTILFDELVSSSQLQYLLCNSNYFTGSIASSIHALSKLLQLSLFENYLTSTLPDELGTSLSMLEELYLYTNYLSGNLQPASIASMSSLQYLLIRFNLFTGTLDGLFDPSAQHQVYVIDLTDNLFSGSIDASIFLLPQLSAFSSTRNCLQGRLPGTICAANASLTSISLNGVGSNPLCVSAFKNNALLSLILKGSFAKDSIYGSIPSCLFTQMPYLTSLSLSGNGLTGSLSELAHDSNLSSLILSNNQLTGSIPSSLQRHAFTGRFELQGNRMSGSLVKELAVTSNQQSLSLSVNRISGPIPPSITSASGSSTPSSGALYLDVLSGNIFTCSVNSIPSADISSRSYSCGSDALNIALAAYGAVFLLFAGLTCFIYYAFIRNLLPWNSFYHQISLLLVAFQVTSTGYVRSSILKPHQQVMSRHIPSSLISSLDSLRMLQALSLLIIVVSTGLLMPLNIAMNEFTSKYSYHYGWIVSIALLRGIAPTIFCSLSLAILAALSALAICTVDRWSSRWLHLLAHKRTAAPISSAITQINPLLADQQLQNQQPVESSRAKEGKSIYRWFISYAHRPLVILALHLVNLTVAFAVNISYVGNVVDASSYTHRQIQGIQLALGLFKVIWNASFVVRSFEYLRNPKYFDPQLGRGYLEGAIQHRFLMSVLNTVLAPVVATIVSNRSCFYYAFNPSPSTQSSFSFEQCSNILVYQNKATCLHYDTTTFTTSFRPPFAYSYNCGSELLTAYTPVLVYMTIFTSLLTPAALFFALAISWEDYLPAWLRHRLAQSQKQETAHIFGVGLQVISMQNLCLLFTFGLAYPPLACFVAVGILLLTLVARLRYGRYLIHRQQQQHLEDKEEEEERQMYVGVAAQCWPWIIVTITIFWSLIIFDFIADQSGAVAGGIACSVVSGSLIITWILIVYRYRDNHRQVSWLNQQLAEHFILPTITAAPPSHPSSSGLELTDDAGIALGHVQNSIIDPVTFKSSSSSALAVAVEEIASADLGAEDQRRSSVASDHDVNPLHRAR
jgi:hypothetical protein